MVVDLVFLLSFVFSFSCIIYGIHLVSWSAQKLLGSRLEILFRYGLSSPWKGLAVGFIITSLLHSFGLVLLVLTGLVSGGVSLVSIVPILLGAGLGMTTVPQFLSFFMPYATSVADLILLPVSTLVFAGLIIYLVFNQRKVARLGEIFIGLGYFLVGSLILIEMIPGMIRYGGVFYSVDYLFPVSLLGGMFGVLFLIIWVGLAMVVRNSMVLSIVVLCLGATEMIDLPSAVMLFFGTVLGLNARNVIVAIRQNRYSDKITILYLLFNIISVLLCIGFFPLFLAIIKFTSEDVARQVANAFTLYYIVAIITALLLAPRCIRFVDKIIPLWLRERKIDDLSLHRELICTPSIAIEHINNNLLKMLSVASVMLADSRSLWLQEGGDFNKISTQEQEIDEMTKKVSEYIVRVAQQNLHTSDNLRVYSLMHIVSDIERLCDHIKVVSGTFRDLQQRNVSFSPKEQEEIAAVFGKLFIMQNLTIKALEENNLELAYKIIYHENKVDEIIQKVKYTYLTRQQLTQVNDGSKSYFFSVLYHLERIGDHYDNIAFAIIDRLRSV